MHNELPSHFHAIEILEQWLWKQPNREAVVDIPVYPWKIAVAVDGYCSKEEQEAIQLVLELTKELSDG